MCLVHLMLPRHFCPYCVFHKVGSVGKKVNSLLRNVFFFQAASLPVSPNQASAADAQSPHISSNMTILKPNKQRRRTLRCKPKAGMDLAPDPRAHPDGSRRIQLPLLAPKRSPRPIIQPHQLLHTQDLCARSAVFHSEQLPAQTESPDSSPLVPTSLIFGFS